MIWIPLNETITFFSYNYFFKLDFINDQFYYRNKNRLIFKKSIEIWTRGHCAMNYRRDKMSFYAP